MTTLSRTARTKFVSLVTLAAFLAPMIPRPSLADTAPVATAAGTVEGQTGLGSDESGGASLGGALAAASIQPSTGLLQSSYDFAIPKARGDVQPKLSLTYSSAGGLGFAGQGWDLAIPSIERHNLSGAPQYIDNPASPSTLDRFTFGGAPLVPICVITASAGCGLAGEQMPQWATNWLYYRLEKEDGTLLRFFWNPSGRIWRVIAKSGATMEFGVPSDNPADLAGVDLDAPPALASPVVFRWNLVRQYDTHRTPSGRPSNLIEYKWAQLGAGSMVPRGYLTDVYDTPPLADGEPAPASFAHHVHLQVSTPQQNGYTTTAAESPIWKLRQMARLDGVDVTSSDFAGGSSRRQVRRYHLTYAYAGTNYIQASFQLQTAQMEGTTADPASRPTENASTGLLGPTACKMFPPTTFTYTQASAAPSFNYVGATGTQLPGILDANGDGLPDVLAQNNVFLNTFNTAPNKWASPTVTFAAPLQLGETIPLMRPASINYNAGSFAPSGNLNILWFGSYGANAGTNTIKYETLGLLDFSGQWEWTLQQPPGSFTLYQQPTNVTTAGPIQYSATVSDEEKYADVDIDGDGLVDLMTTALYTVVPGYQNRLLGGRFTQALPNGAIVPFTRDPGFTVDGQTGPVVPKVCVGGSNTSAQLFDGSTYGFSIADYNGDGLPDWIRMGDDGVYYWPGHGDGTFGVCPDFTLNCACEKASGQLIVHAGAIPDVAISGQFDDVTGDGLADLIVNTYSGFTLYPNSFEKNNIDPVNAVAVDLLTPFPMGHADGAVFLFADMDGSGTDDLIVTWVGNMGYVDMTGGSLPGLLSDIDNGLGAHTHVTYDTTAHLDYLATKSGQPWQTHSPQSLHVVTSITASDALPASIGHDGPPIGYDAATTVYTYTNPIFDARERTFVGFATVDEESVGATPEPTSHVTTTYYVSACDLMPADRRCAGAVDYVARSLRGLPVLTEVFDEYGMYLSTTHRAFTETQLYHGLDGRIVHLVLPSQVDTYGYDDAPFVAGNTSVTATAGVSWHGIGNSGPFVDDATFTLRSTNAAHSVVYMSADAFGNVTETDDSGYVDNSGNPLDGTVVASSEVWAIQPDRDGTHWTWRVASQTVKAGIRPVTTVVPPPSLPRTYTMTYDSEGDVTDVYGLLSGGIPLQRSNENGAAFAPSPSTQSAASGIINLAHVTYDPAGSGNAMRFTGPNLRCTDFAFDPYFASLPAAKKVYDNGCGTGMLATLWKYDGVIGQIANAWAPDGSQVALAHDEFGRVASIAKADPNTVGGVLKASTTIETIEIPGQGERIHAVITDFAKTTESYSYADGFGRPIVSLRSADTSAAAGDAQPWILAPRSLRGPKGGVVGTFAPTWYGQDPTNPPLTFGQGSARRVYFDAFGRVRTTADLDGTLTGAYAYHASGYEVRDAEESLSTGPHVGAYARADLDGHGRIARMTTFSPGRNVETDFGYEPTGEVASVTRTAPDGSYQRWMQYDSLGRMVLNAEPNTSLGFSADRTKAGAMKAWRYAYDDAGDLIGTSDARGCGENRFYDGVGRLLAEDYSPCLAAQGAYTPPSGAPATTLAGYEASYAFASAPGATGQPSLDSGRLSDVYDRAQHSHFTYDDRGRTVQIDKWIAPPGTTTLAQPVAYDGYVSTMKLGYDEEDRVVSQTTGADVPELLGQNASLVASSGPSSVTTTYSARGLIESVQGSYGALMTKTVVDADGAPLSTTYGDLAKTTASFGYDSRRRVHEYSVARTAPSLWSSPPTATYSPPTELGSVATKLVDDVFTYDAVNNPTYIADARIPAEWPAHAKPSDRQAFYDDEYRLSILVHKGTDGFSSTSPSTTASCSPVPSGNSPNQNRVQTEAFAYDGLGSMTGSSDDASLFFDRSMGTMSNGRALGGTVAAGGPNQLMQAQNTSASTGGNASLVYDGAGNVVQEVVVRAATCSTADCSQLFRYDWDELGQLSRARRFDFAYWPAGSTAHAAPPAAVNNPGQYVYPALPSSLPSVDVTYSYDAAGERVLRGSAHPGALRPGPTPIPVPFPDSSRPELSPIQFEGPASYTVEIFPSLRLEGATWDPAANRYERDAQTEAVYLVANGASLGRVISEAGLPSPTGSKQHVFLELGNGVGSSTTILDKETSEVVEATAYQAFGTLDSDFRSTRWEGFREPFKYMGKEADVEIGLTYYGARYYSPQLMRWMSPDPLAIHGLGADLNPYAFVRGSPLAYADPTGLVPEGECDGSVGPCKPAGAETPVGGSILTAALVGAAALLGAGAVWLAEHFLTMKSPLPPPSAVHVFSPSGGGGGGSNGSAHAAPSGKSAAPAPKPVQAATFDPWANTGMVTRWILTSSNPVASFMSSDKDLANLQDGFQFVAENAGIIAVTGGAGELAPAFRGMGAFIADTRGGMLIANGLRAVSETATTVEATEMHHAWPKYLGGAIKQELVPLARSLHQIFHAGLDEILPRQKGTAYYEALGPAERQRLLQGLASYTRAFDAEYGTNVYEALVKAGLPQ